jgi:hypothetical protein
MVVGFRLFNFGIGVHLLQAEDPEGMPPKKTEIDPKDNHISFTVSPHAHQKFIPWPHHKAALITCY